MEIVEVPLERLREAPWNPNEAAEGTLRRLAASMERFGLVVPLVVRSLDDAYEVLSGNQRLRVLRANGVDSVACVLVQADDARARLLAQALNAIHGADELNKKAALVKDLLAAMSAEEVAAILPDSVEAVRGLASIREANPASLAEQVKGWAAVERAKAESGLHVTSFSLSNEQKESVEHAVGLMLPRLGTTDVPNRRGVALSDICVEWAAGRGYTAGRGRRGRRRAGTEDSPAESNAAVSPGTTQGGDTDG